jgi:hypothetical protein
VPLAVSTQLLLRRRLCLILTKYLQVGFYTYFLAYSLSKLTDEIFLERLRAKEQRPDSFAEHQAKLARETAEKLNTLGEDLFQVLQGTRHS